MKYVSIFFLSFATIMSVINVVTQVRLHSYGWAIAFGALGLLNGYLLFQMRPKFS